MAIIAMTIIECHSTIPRYREEKFCFSDSRVENGEVVCTCNVRINTGAHSSDGDDINAFFSDPERVITLMGRDVMHNHV